MQKKLIFGDFIVYGIEKLFYYIICTRQKKKMNFEKKNLKKTDHFFLAFGIFKHVLWRAIMHTHPSGSKIIHMLSNDVQK